MNNWLQERQQWQSTCRNLQQENYRLERQIQKQLEQFERLRHDFAVRLAEKDKLVEKMDKQMQHLRDDIAVLELELALQSTNTNTRNSLNESLCIDTTFEKVDVDEISDDTSFKSFTNCI